MSSNSCSLRRVLLYRNGISLNITHMVTCITGEVSNLTIRRSFNVWRKKNSRKIETIINSVNKSEKNWINLIVERSNKYQNFIIIRNFFLICYLLYLKILQSLTADKFEGK